ncbi:MAG TPA: discoidin domain-containing protein [Candidatus Methylacidiphilales bacterium]|nr:discoidin domain-containing protein [Candidatus Methylacidiphilales bacterium]
MLSVVSAGADAPRPATFCNPVNLPYRFQLKGAVRREAADPTMVIYKGEYWLFPSKSGGYWHSPDCLNWSYVPIKTLPIETYAPDVEIVGGRMLWTAGGQGLWTNDDPTKDAWTKVSNVHVPSDPDLFLAKDGRLYLYGGCSDKTPITGVELDTKTLQAIGAPVPCIAADTATRGWETLKGVGKKPWIEGSWMTEHDGTFYLQYAAPGTEVDDYGDGVFTAPAPLGPFTYAPYSPFSFKPTGFIRGAGHGSTFQDLAGNYWHIASGVVGIRDVFERRLQLFPAGFTPDGELYSDAYLGDYPHYAPGPGYDPAHPMPDWMLLSCHKQAKASSTLDDAHAVDKAFDENIHDFWSAKTGDKGEWLEVDLEHPCDIDAVQTNFMDQDAQVFGMLQGDAYQYRIEGSSDGQAWTTLIDKTQNTVDAPHDYVQLAAPVRARYVRLTNVHCPAGAKLSISGFRIFGRGTGALPGAVKDIKAVRCASDSRRATVTWSPVSDADFYIVRYALGPGKPFTNYQIYGATTATLNALNGGVPYLVTVQSVNENGVTQTPEAVKMF